MSLTRQQQQQQRPASRGGRPAGRPGPAQLGIDDPPPAPPEEPGEGHGDDYGHDHEHMLRADRDWWAVYALEDGVALPVMCWLMGPPDDASLDVPVISGVVPDGFGDWERAEDLRGFVDYTYRPGGPPTSAEVRALAGRLVRRFAGHYADGHEPWEALDEIRAWLEEQSPPS